MLKFSRLVERYHNAIALCLCDISKNLALIIQIYLMPNAPVSICIITPWWTPFLLQNKNLINNKAK